MATDKKPAKPAIELRAVKSASINSWGYDAASKTLAVRFANGGLYHYEGVTPEAIQALEGADSFGKHFMAHIRGKFDGKKQG